MRGCFLSVILRYNTSMVIEGPLAIILVVFLAAVVVTNASELIIGFLKRREARKQIKLLDEKMALIKEKMKTQSLDLQESLTIFNKEYAQTLKKYQQQYGYLSKSDDLSSE